MRQVCTCVAGCIYIRRGLVLPQTLRFLDPSGMDHSSRRSGGASRRTRTLSGRQIFLLLLLRQLSKTIATPLYFQHPL